MSSGIRATVFRRAAEMAGVEPDDVTEETTLESLGLDSADVVVLTMELEEVIGREIDVAVLFECETLGEATEQIMRLLSEPRGG